MPRYRVLVSVPMMFQRTVTVETAADQAEAIGEALDEAQARARALQSEHGSFVESKEPASVLFCTRVEEEASVPAAPADSSPESVVQVAPAARPPADARPAPADAPYSVLYFDELLKGTSLLIRNAEELAELRARAASVVDAQTKAQAVALASLVRENIDPRLTALVVDAKSIQFSVINYYGSIALVAYGQPEDAAARNDNWRLLESGQPSVPAARRRALQLLDQGYVRTIGIAVRRESDPPRRGMLEVIAVLQDAGNE